MSESSGDRAGARGRVRQMVRCPQCKKLTKYDQSNPERPFCSLACKQWDLAAWANQDYAIAGREVAGKFQSSRSDEDE